MVFSYLTFLSGTQPASPSRGDRTILKGDNCSTVQYSSIQLLATLMALLSEVSAFQPISMHISSYSICYLISIILEQSRVTQIGVSYIYIYIYICADLF